MTKYLRILGALAWTLVATTPTHAQGSNAAMNIVLVHGAWADGSGWQRIHDILRAKGHRVSIVQNPLTSLADDVAAVNRVLARQDGPALLVGHSYGGAVISEAGGAANVAGLVYVAAFVPDAGESVASLTEGGAPPPLQPSADGFLFSIQISLRRHSRQTYQPHKAPSLLPRRSRRRAWRSARPSPPAWKTRRSFYVLATDDRVIPRRAGTHGSARQRGRHQGEGQPCRLHVATRGRG